MDELKQHCMSHEAFILKQTPSKNPGGLVIIVFWLSFFLIEHRRTSSDSNILMLCSHQTLSTGFLALYFMTCGNSRVMQKTLCDEACLHASGCVKELANKLFVQIFA